MPFPLQVVHRAAARYTTVCVSLWVALNVALLAQPFRYNAALIRTIDGDTYILRIALEPRMLGVSQEISIRLLGLDTPELHTPEGQRARREADNLLRTAARIEVDFTGARTFERYVARVFYDGQDLAEVLRARGHVKR